MFVVTKPLCKIVFPWVLMALKRGLTLHFYSGLNQRCEFSPYLSLVKIIVITINL